jgi:hypothetical protein
MEIPQLLCSRRYCPANIPQLVIPLNYSAISSHPSLQNSTELIAPNVLVIVSRHRPHRKHHSSIVAFVSELIYDKTQLFAGLARQSAHGVQLYSSCKYFLELLCGNE